jgi:membrane protein insertase Oxa1/YidC/SpoIIIJ
MFPLLSIEMSSPIAEGFILIGVIFTTAILMFLAFLLICFLSALIRIYWKSETILKIAEEYECKKRQEREEKEFQTMKKIRERKNK